MTEDRRSRFLQPLDGIVVVSRAPEGGTILSDETIAAGRKRIIDGENADDVINELADKEVALRAVEEHEDLLDLEDAGHGFHGNQYTGGGTGEGTAKKVNEGANIKLKDTPKLAVDARSTTRLSKLETGTLGEQLAVAWLQKQGFKDARSLNEHGNNFAVDLVEDHRVFEVKAGLASNGASAQQWRATIGQPGAKERAWLAKASATAKAKWNDRKQAAILDRKKQAIAAVSKRLGHKVGGGTLGLIINPDTHTVDVHMFDGFHLRIGWKSHEAKGAYRGSFKY